MSPNVSPEECIQDLGVEPQKTSDILAIETSVIQLEIYSPYSFQKTLKVSLASMSYMIWFARLSVYRTMNYKLAFVSNYIKTVYLS